MPTYRLNTGSSDTRGSWKQLLWLITGTGLSDSVIWKISHWWELPVRRAEATSLTYSTCWTRYLSLAKPFLGETSLFFMMKSCVTRAMTAPYSGSDRGSRAYLPVNWESLHSREGGIQSSMNCRILSTCREVPGIEKYCSRTEHQLMQ